MNKPSSSYGVQICAILLSLQNRYQQIRTQFVTITRCSRFLLRPRTRVSVALKEVPGDK